MKKPVNNSLNSLSAFQILNLLDASHEKPTMGSEIVGYRGTKWIKWGEDGNAGLFPQRIAEAYQNSKTLRAVLSQKSNLVASDLKTENESLQKKIDKFTSPKTHYDLRELIYRVSLDVQLHGEGFIKEVRFRNGRGRRTERKNRNGRLCLFVCMAMLRRFLNGLLIRCKI